MNQYNFILIALFAITFGMMSCKNDKAAKVEEAETPVAAPMISGDMNVDLENSSVTWKGEILGMKAHKGNLTITDASLSAKDGVITAGKFVVDMATMSPTDDAYDEKSTKEGLVGHLSSTDFFDVANHPTATFEITGAEGNKVMGNLTVRGKTHPETVENVMISPNEHGATFEGTLTFDRQKYGAAFSGPAKDIIISDNVVVVVSLKVKN